VTNFARVSAATLSFQIGPDANTQAALTIDNISSYSGMTDIAAGTVTTTAGAASAIAHADNAISQVNILRSNIGAFINRLNYAADNLTNISTNTAESRSRIMDTDYAQATSELAKRQILQQAATAMLAQANQQQASVLSLLQ